MKIAILTIFTDSWKSLNEVVGPGIEKYCTRHGYHYRRLIMEEKYAGVLGWEKLVKSQELFNEGYDAVWCLDADAAITNHEIKIEEFLFSPEHYCYICRDVNGLNCGSFILVKSSWTKDFISWCLNQRGVPNMHCENDAFNAYEKEYKLTPIAVLEHPAINSYLYEEYAAPLWGRINPEFESYPKPTKEQGQWEKGCFVLHLPGIGMERRLEIFKNLP